MSVADRLLTSSVFGNVTLSLCLATRRPHCVLLLSPWITLQNSEMNQIDTFFFSLKELDPINEKNQLIHHLLLLIFHSKSQGAEVEKGEARIHSTQVSVAFNMCVYERKLKYTEWTLASMRRQVGREATVQLSWCEAMAPSSIAPHIDIKIPAWTLCHPNSFFQRLSAVIGCGNYWPGTNAQHK